MNLRKWMNRLRLNDVHVPTRHENECMKWLLQRSGIAPTIFLFVVDTCQDEENLQALKVCSFGLAMHY